MKPSRRVIVLTVAAVLCGALLTAVTLLGLDRPHAAVTELESRLVPAGRALERAAASNAASQQALLDALAAPPDGRGALIAEAQQAGSRASNAWGAYLKLAFGTEAEKRLQRVYESSVARAQSIGATVFLLADGADRNGYLTALLEEQAVAAESVSTLEQIDRDFYEARRTARLADAHDSIDSTRTLILVTFALVLFVGLVNALWLLRGAFRQERVSDARAAEREYEGRRSDLENQLQRGLEMEPTEESTYEVIRAALELVRPDHPVEVMVAESTSAHFRQVLSTDEEGFGPGCAVTSPAECPAASTGQTRLFISSTRLDACPYLRSRDEPPQSAACVPISIAGTNSGMVHTTGPDQASLNAHELSELELVARKSGDRIGFLRVLAQSESQARIDRLTGLLNRRSLDERAGELLSRGEELVVAFADLDHFKDLNDEHGHEIGDRALRLFGRVLRDSVRPADIPARYGGEEFVVLLPDCTLADARVVANRLRERLAAAIARSTVPTFTVSVGLAAWQAPEAFADTVARADAALLSAKQAGRDRVVGADEIPDVNGTVAQGPSANGPESAGTPPPATVRS